MSLPLLAIGSVLNCVDLDGCGCGGEVTVGVSDVACCLGILKLRRVSSLVFKKSLSISAARGGFFAAMLGVAGLGECRGGCRLSCWPGSFLLAFLSTEASSIDGGAGPLARLIFIDGDKDAVVVVVAVVLSTSIVFFIVLTRLAKCSCSTMRSRAYLMRSCGESRSLMPIYRSRITLESRVSSSDAHSFVYYLGRFELDQVGQLLLHLLLAVEQFFVQHLNIHSDQVDAMWRNVTR